jgi:ectoine hydroxylase-related dioxygenase (phytanoyl-CoA dioxygenase family)
MTDTEPIRGSTRSAATTTVHDPMALLTDDIHATYQRDGVVMIPGLLHPEWLLLVELGLQRVLANSGQQKHLFFEGDSGEFVETIRNTEVTPELQRLVYDSPVADVIGALIGSENLWLYSDEFFVKEGGNCERTPWHQDTPYWPIAGAQIASMWISLDPLPASECLEYVAGSHRGTIFDGFSPSKVKEDPTVPHYGEGFPPLPDIEGDRDAFPIVSWDIQPGDVIVAHPSVLHGGGPTGPTSRRRALTVRCYGDDIVYATRPSSRPTVPLTPGLSLSLSPGDPLRSPWYPRLRPVPEHQRAL